MGAFGLDTHKKTATHPIGFSMVDKVKMQEGVE